ncbi:amino acid--tRNA ligase-related protein [Azotobacter sp. CWF10]
MTRSLTVVHDWPASRAALARIRAGDAAAGRAFRAVPGVVELANGYHELNDADEQRARFQRDQQRRHERGQVQPPLDEALLAALPGVAGLCRRGAGVDRLLMAMNRHRALQMCWPTTSPTRDHHAC